MTDQLKVLELKSELHCAILSAALQSQNVGRYTVSGTVSDLIDAQAKERKETNKVEDLIDELVKEALK
jgi:hypothetical protein